MQPGLRHDVRTGVEPRVPRQDHRRAPDGPGEDRRLLRPDQDAPTPGPRDGMEDRQHEHTGVPHRHRHREVHHGQGAAGRVLQRPPHHGLARHDGPHAAAGDVRGGSDHGHRRRCRRGPQGDRRPQRPEGLPTSRGLLADGVHPGQARGGMGPFPDPFRRGPGAARPGGGLQGVPGQAPLRSPGAGRLSTPGSLAEHPPGTGPRLPVLDGHVPLLAIETLTCGRGGEQRDGRAPSGDPAVARRVDESTAVPRPLVLRGRGECPTDAVGPVDPDGQRAATQLALVGQPVDEGVRPGGSGVVEDDRADLVGHAECCSGQRPGCAHVVRPEQSDGGVVARRTV